MLRRFYVNLTQILLWIERCDSFCEKPWSAYVYFYLSINMKPHQSMLKAKQVCIDENRVISHSKWLQSQILAGGDAENKIRRVPWTWFIHLIGEKEYVYENNEQWVFVRKFERPHDIFFRQRLLRLYRNNCTADTNASIPNADGFEPRTTSFDSIHMRLCIRISFMPMNIAHIGTSVFLFTLHQRLMYSSRPQLNHAQTSSSWNFCRIRRMRLDWCYERDSLQSRHALFRLT